MFPNLTTASKKKKRKKKLIPVTHSVDYPTNLNIAQVTFIFSVKIPRLNITLPTVILDDFSALFLLVFGMTSNLDLNIGINNVTLLGRIGEVLATQDSHSQHLCIPVSKTTL